MKSNEVAALFGASISLRADAELQPSLREMPTSVQGSPSRNCSLHCARIWAATWFGL
jgi:hypothetical protein